MKLPHAPPCPSPPTRQNIQLETARGVGDRRVLCLTDDESFEDAVVIWSLLLHGTRVAY